MLSPPSVCLSAHLPLCVSQMSPTSSWGVGVRLWEEKWGPHIVVLLLQGASFLSALLHIWRGVLTRCPPHPRRRAAPLSLESSHLRWPLLSLSLTETLQPVASPLPCSRGLLVHAASLHGLLGEERDVASTSLTAQPAPMNVTTAQTPSPPPAPGPANLLSFINSRLFLNKPSLYRTAPLLFTWGPLSPKPPFLLF